LQPRTMHRQPFPQFHGRGLVAQSGDKDFHFWWAVGLILISE
jgi:hypothetical protein